MAKLLRRQGLHGWRRHLPLPGHPDFSWPLRKVALFVDGCFWHGCSRCYRSPAQNQRYWREKLERNKARDRAVGRRLRAMGWSVVRIWECQVHSARSLIRLGRVLESRMLHSGGH